MMIAWTVEYLSSTHIWQEGVLSKDKSTNGGKCVNLTQIYGRIIP